MSNPDKMLIRKIKNREKHKLRLLKKQRAKHHEGNFDNGLLELIRNCIFVESDDNSTPKALISKVKRNRLDENNPPKKSIFILYS